MRAGIGRNMAALLASFLSINISGLLNFGNCTIFSLERKQNTKDFKVGFFG
jgi:hypothetical protein